MKGLVCFAWLAVLWIGTCIGLGVACAIGLKLFNLGWNLLSW
jgi:hypothetical protein